MMVPSMMVAVHLPLDVRIMLKSWGSNYRSLPVIGRDKVQQKRELMGDMRA